MNKILNTKIEIMEKRILNLIPKETKFWYWTGADALEPANYEKEQERYGSTIYDMALDSLETKGMVKTVKIKGAANAEYYKLTPKGRNEIKGTRVRA
jgi:hypothetical protein